MTDLGTPLYFEAAMAALARALQDDARTDECYRCPTDPAGRIDPLEPEPGLCRGCLDEVSHDAENRCMHEAWDRMGEDEWGDLPTVGGA